MSNKATVKRILAWIGVLLLSIVGIAETAYTNTDMEPAQIETVDEVFAYDVDVLPGEIEETDLMSSEVYMEYGLSEDVELMAPEASDDDQKVVDINNLENPETNGNVPKSSIKVNAVPKKLKLGVNEKYTLNGTVLSDGKKVSYKSSKPSVASVDKKGVVTAKKTGKATVTVRKGKLKLATCKITVVAAPKKVSMSKTKATLEMGKSLQLKAKLPKNTASNQLKWKSNNKKVATVDENGKVKAVAAGKAKITVTTFNKKKATCLLTVTKASNGGEELSWQDFARATSSLVKHNSGKIGIASAGSPYATARLIVKVRGDLPDLSQFKVESIFHDTEKHYMIQLANDKAAEECANYLMAYPEVEYVEPDHIVESNGLDASEIQVSNASWGVAAIGADKYAKDLVNRGKTKKTVVAVIDTGVEYSHPMLKGKLYKGFDVLDNDSKAQDENGHGTHVSGIIVQCTPGLNISVMPLRVFNSSGEGVGESTCVIIGNAVERAIKDGADVINMSLSCVPTSKYVDEKVEKAIRSGIVVIASAGNKNTDTKYSSPAHIKNCIVVAAVDRDRNRAEFSNHGDAVDISAPGVDIISSYKGNMYASGKGTSQAAPHVAASAAMLLCDDSSLSPSDISNKLRSAATDLGSSGWDQYYGAGFLNLRPFVHSSAPTSMPTVVPTAVPTLRPTAVPTLAPTAKPTPVPTATPASVISDWVGIDQVPANASIVATKTQYRYSDASYSDWSEWSGWTVDREETNDLKREDSATVYYWYRYACPHCGTFMHVYNKCYTWAGGCGNTIGSDRAQVTWLTTSPGEGVQNWEGTGRIMTGSGPKDRWFYWVDSSQGYPNGRSETGYRYATRSLSWGGWTGWSDTEVTASETRQVETRTLYRYIAE